jgi:hypothetical protein
METTQAIKIDDELIITEVGADNKTCKFIKNGVAYNQKIQFTDINPVVD